MDDVTIFTDEFCLLLLCCGMLVIFVGIIGFVSDTIMKDDDQEPDADTLNSLVASTAALNATSVTNMAMTNASMASSGTTI